MRGFRETIIPLFWQQRRQEIAGVALCGAACVLLVLFALGTQEQLSWNTASDTPARHPLGAWASFVADGLWQMLGHSVWFVAVVWLIWGIKYLVRSPPLWMAWRVGALVCALPFLSVVLHGFYRLIDGSAYVLLGGVVGKAAYHAGGMVLVWLGWSVPRGLALLAIATIGSSALIYAVGLTRQEGLWLWHKCREIARKIAQLALTLARTIGHLALYVFRLVKGDFEPAMPVFGGRQNSWRAIHVDKKREQEDDKEDEDDKALTPPAPPVMSEEEALPPLSGEGVQTSQRVEPEEAIVPPLDLLKHRVVARRDSIDEVFLQEQQAQLLSTLADFGIKGHIISRQSGPVVTLYAFEPAAGTKVSRVVALADDLARALSALSVRIALVPGQNVIGIEVPLKKRQIVYLHDVLEQSRDGQEQARSLPLALGCGIDGTPMMRDLRDMPHLLVAGTTGSGKSVALNAMIMSLLYHCPPSVCRLLLIDPKRLELSAYEGLAHLLAPVVHDAAQTASAFQWLVKEMERRYALMASFGVRHIDGYHRECARLEQQNREPSAHQDGTSATTALPFIVVIVDEVADVMLVSGRAIEGSIQRLAQMARAAGIHIILATQRPSVDVITGTIKANFPTRLSFQVTTKIDSRTILGEQGAEKLLGQGDGLLMAPGRPLTRLHAPFVSDPEVEDVVSWLKEAYDSSEDLLATNTITTGATGVMGETGAGGGEGVMNPDFSGQEQDDEEDILYARAVAIVLEGSRASISLLQRHLQIGYNRAARIMERMEQQGLVSSADPMGRRTVLQKK